MHCLEPPLTQMNVLVPHTFLPPFFHSKTMYEMPTVRQSSLKEQWRRGIKDSMRHTCFSQSSKRHTLPLPHLNRRYLFQKTFPKSAYLTSRYNRIDGLGLGLSHLLAVL